MEIIQTNSFKKSIKRYKKDKLLIKRLKNQIKKIIKNPEIGDFLKNNKKGERKLYVPPFRLLYSLNSNKNTIYLLDFDNRDKIYRK
ncbi:type II toxin-antitoxin system RelE/ParE family toxin [Candidatus Woesearchaeota archaeon]|jgi:mRNA-degrading endonuclease RelE of RelBE toxin-antitoxin system|nr:type II toxin-antitoxin system RelE/ParE family toxin [Candidatus Woesearchaeota archaeon]MBT3438503.1 type II toxin-antitoxin system RelE/ParE family toxin [Candidatus Woesearchaeota archaeon]MBT4058403.1 type II toxin-antitoxin system RelE/ParE family toxin [Candidatus Woesearchaeota archaeon]MBT4207652.1 type II toxin-antitoxin system RelE/ParE family toxin [Candidatus Woesearchaeota archaeon]MBT4730584.1 type II toxin-antitoxin system RelE/ParE family toxin [Candidatus Woesearchaeota arc